MLCLHKILCFFVRYVCCDIAMYLIVMIARNLLNHLPELHVVGPCWEIYPVCTATTLKKITICTCGILGGTIKGEGYRG